MSIHKADPLNEERRVIGEGFYKNLYKKLRFRFSDGCLRTRVANYKTIWFQSSNFVII